MADAPYQIPITKLPISIGLRGKYQTTCSAETGLRPSLASRQSTSCTSVARGEHGSLTVSVDSVRWSDFQVVSTRRVDFWMEALGLDIEALFDERVYPP